MNGVIQATQERELTLASNTASVSFDTVDLRTRSAMNCSGFVNHNPGSALFSILDGGVYRINFNTNITSNTAGNVALALFADGVQVPGTEMDATITAAGDWENISFNKEVRVCCKGTVNLSVNSLPTTTYSGSGTPVITDTQIPIIKNANINFTRLA
jgi:exopolysaccharide biosynthesis protein